MTEHLCEGIYWLSTADPLALRADRRRGCTSRSEEQP
jgi:hypothetical protein